MWPAEVRDATVSRRERDGRAGCSTEHECESPASPPATHRYVVGTLSVSRACREVVHGPVRDASETSLVLPRNLGKNGRLLHFLLRHDFPA